MHILDHCDSLWMQCVTHIESVEYLEVLDVVHDCHLESPLHQQVLRMAVADVRIEGFDGL
jgi:hypothetical protein